MATYQLQPTDHHRSFYGKALVEVLEDGTEILTSYGTEVIAKTPTGALYKMRQGDWWATATTLRHIKAFCGINKAQALALDFWQN